MTLSCSPVQPTPEPQQLPVSDDEIVLDFQVAVGQVVFEMTRVLPAIEHGTPPRLAFPRLEFMASAVCSEEVLARDWLSPEEDEAWKHL